MKLSDESLARLGEHPVMVFDGECVLCNRTLRIALRLDRRAEMRFVVAQSSLGARLYDELGLRSGDYDSFIVISGGRVFTKLDGVFELCRIFGGLWRVFTPLRFLPKRLTDFAYDIVAKNRYRLFGRLDQCMIPDASIKARFLDGAV